MKSTCVIILLCILFLNTAFAQAPPIQWAKCYGGTLAEQISSIAQTSDNGFIIAGYSDSDDGDITDHHGSVPIADCWILKIDSIGNLQWAKSFGGTQADLAYSIKITKDGGYIFAASSSSNDGDVTGHHGGSSRDYWIVRLSEEGEILWEKSFGGSESDEAYDIIQTFDGGYLVAGFSLSKDGEVTNNHGGGDYWIIKLSEKGDLEWENSLGGSSFDEPNSLIEMPDSNLLVAGHSYSDDGDVSGHHGSSSQSDGWIVKLNSAGKFISEKSLPGITNENATDLCLGDNGSVRIVGGSRTSFPKRSVVSNGMLDFYSLTLGKFGGIHDVSLMGGSQDDIALAVERTIDGGYITIGQTLSFDKEVEGNHGYVDSWIVKTSATDTLEWQKCLGGSSFETAYDVKQTSDGGYIIANLSNSDDGQVTDNKGGSDFWIVKLAPERIATAVSENQLLSKLSIYPNPAANQLTITCHSPSNATIEITDLFGRVLKMANAIAGEGNPAGCCAFTFGVADLPRGVYLIKMIAGDAILAKRVEIIH